MTGISLRALSVVVFLHVFSEPTSGGPPASTDSLRARPPKPSYGLPGLKNLNGLRQRLNRKRMTAKEDAIIALMLQNPAVRRSPLDNMPLVNPGAGLAYGMPIMRPNPLIDYKMLFPGTPSVPDTRAPVPPGTWRFKRK